MTSAPTDQRRTFDAAIENYKAGDTRAALAGFVAITATQPTMSDAWLGRIACGDHDHRRARGGAPQFAVAVSRDRGGSGWSTVIYTPASTPRCT